MSSVASSEMFNERATICEARLPRVDQVLQAKGGEGVDLIVDQVRATSPAKISRPPKSTDASSMSAGSAAPTQFQLRPARRINYIGITFRTRTIDEIREIFHQVRKDIWSAVGPASCNYRSTRCSPSTSVRRLSAWRPISRGKLTGVIEGGRCFQGPRC
jgi:lipopolysaccharide/colanic/teichoic acid biosynthesis glycosyltransferase